MFVTNPSAFSPIVDTSKIIIDEQDLIFITNENKEMVYIEEIVLGKIDNILIAGIEGVKNMFFKSDINFTKRF